MSLAPAGAGATFAGQNGKIAFQAQEEGGGLGVEIFSVNPDGTSQQNLTNTSDVQEGKPAWSPDGTKIAFNSPAGLEVMNPDGSGRTVIGPGDSPAWSPDGSRFAVVRADPLPDIWVIDADGSNPVRLTDNNLENEDFLEWSPDGKWILYQKNGGGSGLPIRKVAADGSTLIPLANGSHPTWSPDGQRIAYLGVGGVWTMRADGSEQTQLTTGLTSVGWFAWSPDGSKIAFEWSTGGTRNIWTVNAVDGSGLTQVTQDTGSFPSKTYLDWQPIPYTGYARPKSAGQIRQSLVPAYAQCTAPNRTHGPPLAFGSCSPPGQTSPHLTVGTPDANGAAAASTGSLRLKLFPGAPGPPHDTQAFAMLNVTDVRCTGLATPCGGANDQGGADYAGELDVRMTLRMTDRWDSVSQDPATMTDYTLRLPMFSSCTATSSTAVGATCSATMNLAGFIPGVVPEGKRAIWEVDQVEVLDGGPDGDAATAAGNEPFLRQGIFVP